MTTVGYLGEGKHTLQRWIQVWPHQNWAALCTSQETSSSPIMMMIYHSVSSLKFTNGNKICVNIAFTNISLWKIDVCQTLMPPFPNISRIDLTFDLLTWISIGIIYSSKTIYLPSLNFLGQSTLEFSVAQGVGDKLELWPTDLNINRDHLPIKDYLPTKFWAYWAKCSWVISYTRCMRST